MHASSEDQPIDRGQWRRALKWFEHGSDIIGFVFWAVFPERGKTGHRKIRWEAVTVGQVRIKPQEGKKK